MVEFLVKRPIAVSMTFIAILVLGFFAIRMLPVSLMPDIDIPEITVQVSVSNTPARELENTVVQPIRRQLMQVAHLSDIRSETRNESAIISLKFDYGTDIDFAFVEVNEKVDRAMNYLPRTIDRPRVIKASATDIPVFYLNLTIKNDERRDISATTGDGRGAERAGGNSDLFPVSQQFVELSRFSSNVIRKRIEQLSEVAMVDISGMVAPELLILPDNRKLDALGITQNTLQTLIFNNNIRLGNLLIRDGQYQYNIRFSSTLQNKADIENIWFKTNDRMFQLKDVASVVEHPQKQKGKVIHNGQDAVTIAVIKQSDARMSTLKEKLNELVAHFETDYPAIRFEVTRNQTQLLDYSIGNLRQNMYQGFILAFMVMFFFLKDYRAPLLIGMTIPISMVISLLLFYILGISINVISLAGIILGAGMIVDNTIIVIDNIGQHREMIGREQTLSDSKLSPLIRACVNGTNEVFRPMLSGVLTTCSVFIPLIFISGLTGALFYDQAMAVTIGQFVSLVVAITFLPVYYRMVYRKEGKPRINRIMEWLNSVDYENIYFKGFKLVMRNQALTWIITGVITATGIIMFVRMEKTRLPMITKNEVLLAIDWNERIHIDENKDRSLSLIGHIDSLLTDHTCLIGEQQFILDKSGAASSSETMIYLKTKRAEDLEPVIMGAEAFLKAYYPQSIFTFEDAGNIFNLIFSDTEEPLVTRLRAADDYGPSYIGFLDNMLGSIRNAFPGQNVDQLSMLEYTILHTDAERMLLHDVTFSTVYDRLKSAFNENQLLLLTDNQDFVPVVLGDETQTIRQIIDNLFVPNQRNELIPVRSLLSEGKGKELKTIVAGKEGEYYPVPFHIGSGQLNQTVEALKDVVYEDRTFEATFTGNILSNRALMNQLIVILMISVALLYFILASQFESLVLPLIVLLEIPIDIFGAVIMLKIGGEGINLMSMIGIIVMTGIIINDSILKIDTINRLHNEGVSLIRAIAEGGHRRLKPILMTALTSILAFLPLLFSSSLGADLQRPLALSLIGGMILGTVVSLFLIPLVYYYFKRATGRPAKAASRNHG